MNDAGCQRDADDVVDERPEEILPNHVNRLLAQFYGFRKCQQVVAHQRNLRHIHRHIRSLSYRHTHVGKGQGLGVVDSVAHHRYLLAFILKFLYQCLLVARQHLALVMLDAGFLSPVVSRFLLVATHHIDLYSFFLQLLHRFLGMRLESLSRLQIQILLLGEIDVLVRNGESAGLVDYEGIDLVEILQRRRILDKNLLLRRLADAHHQGGRSG